MLITKKYNLEMENEDIRETGWDLRFLLEGIIAGGIR